MFNHMHSFSLEGYHSPCSSTFLVPAMFLNAALREALVYKLKSLLLIMCPVI